LGTDRLSLGVTIFIFSFNFIFANVFYDKLKAQFERKNVNCFNAEKYCGAGHWWLVSVKPSYSGGRDQQH
jgi:hypothetical protein